MLNVLGKFLLILSRIDPRIHQRCECDLNESRRSSAASLDRSCRYELPFAHAQHARGSSNHQNGFQNEVSSNLTNMIPFPLHLDSQEHSRDNLAPTLHYFLDFASR